ncbi:MAG: glycerate kinase, partial [Parasporobacterium sp.]|nr:glycerate kinase [Parasporobacterium sp.]
VVSGVAKRAASVGIPVIIVAGCADKSARVPENVRGLFAASEEGRPMDEIIKTCRKDLAAATGRAVELIKGTNR